MVWLYDEVRDIWHERGNDDFVPHRNVPPIAQFVFSAQNITVALDGTHSFDTDGSIVSYAWDFGDGGISTLPNPTHKYNRAGNYVVTLKVRDNDGASASKSQTITVTDAVPTNPNKVPTARFSFTTGGDADPWRLNVDASTSTDSDGAIIKYTWDFGNGVVFETTNPTAKGFYYTADGSYTVTLTVTDDEGATGSTSQIVSVKKLVPNTPPIASFTRSISNRTVAVNASGSSDKDGTITSYSWTWGDGTTSAGVSPSHTYGADGSFTIVLTVQDNNGSTATSAQSVSVSLPVVTPTPPPSTGAGVTGGSGVEPVGSAYQSISGLSGSSFSSKVNTSSKIVSLPTGTQSFSNFADTVGNEYNGVNMNAPAGLVGSGSSFSKIQIAPNSSSRAGNVPAQSAGGTNQVSLMRWNSKAGLILNGFSLIGTSQGHLYNGLRFEVIKGAQITDVLVSGCPGDAGSPPGETFHINDYAGGGNTYTNCTVDGQGIGASGFATNGSGGQASFIANTYTKCVAKNLPYSAGWAFWRTNGGTLTDCVSQNNKTGLLIEQCQGTFRLKRHKFTGNASRDIFFSGSSTMGSAKLILEDCTVDSGKKIVIYCWDGEGSNGTNGVQNYKKSDVSVIINGVTKTTTDYVTFSGNWAV